MPNWCENKLLISSLDEEPLRDFVNRVKDPENNTDLSLGKLLPCPEELNDLNLQIKKSSYDECAELIIKYGHEDQYHWSIANWGTKWDVKAKLDFDGGLYAIYLFESAWAPPVEWIMVAALEYPDLLFQLKYDEPGMCFMGVLKAHGEKIFHHNFDY